MKRRPFPLNPTIGTIPPKQIVGREKEITSLLRLLKGQSVTIEELRRMGKTMVLQKLEELCNSEKVPAEFKKLKFKAKYFSFQGKQNLGEVIDLLIKDISEHKAWYNIDFTKTYAVIKGVTSAAQVEYAGAKFTLNLPEYKKSWKEIFFKTLEDIADQQEKDTSILILMFDELPIMLWEWYKEGKHEQAIELLDILRERRQNLESKGLRFIYCGSIGMQVVLNTFREKFKYTGEPTNEMEEFVIGSMSSEDAVFLCECFTLSGFEIDDDKKKEIWSLVYELTNGLPYYISKLFNLIQTEFDTVLTENTVNEAFSLILNETRHHKAFNQLLDRLKIYYSKDRKNIMMSLLNLLSKSKELFAEEELIRQVDYDKEQVKSALYMLLGDHYLLREVGENGRSYKFKYEIFRQWWRINKA